MATTRNPIQVIKEAKQIAKDHGGFVVEKAGKFLVYRKTQTCNVFLGARGKPDTLRSFVCRCFNFK